MKKYLALLLAFVMVLTVTACGKTASTPTETNSAAASQKETAADTTAASTEAAKQESVNASVIWRSFDDQFQSGYRIIMQGQDEKDDAIALEMLDGQDDVTVVNNRLDTALTKGLDAVAICAPNSECTSGLMEKCSSEKVPTVFFNMEPSKETMTNYENIWYVGAKAKESGEMCAKALINYWNENTEVADKNGDGVLQVFVIQGEIGNSDVILRTEAYQETLEASGIKYEIVAQDTANWDKAQALDLMTTWITAYGIDGVEGVLCNNDSMAMGAVQACQNEGWNKGDAKEFVPVVGIDATVEALEAMKDGSLLGTVLNDRTNQSVAVINALKAAANGTEITADVIGVPCTIEDNYIWIPYQIVDSSNLEECLNLMLQFS